MAVDKITTWVSDNFLKGVIALATFFLYNMYTDFRDVKVTLQQLLINHATVEVRMSALESQTKTNTEDISDLKNKTYIVNVNKQIK